MMAMDGATATGGKEEIMAGRGSASMLDAGELRRSRGQSPQRDASCRRLELPTLGSREG